MEPWFYEHRFLRPRFARQPALEILRRLSAAHELGVRTTWPATEARTILSDVVVVGGGPTGVAAAAALTDAGVRTVVVTAGPSGGRQPRSSEADARVADDVRRVQTGGGILLEGCLCIGYYEAEGVLAAIGESGPIALRADRFVVATGAYDRPLILHGVDLPGVMGIRAFERLAPQGAFTPSHRIGAFAAPIEAARISSTASAFGLRLDWLAGPGTVPSSEMTTFPGAGLARLEGRSSVSHATLDDGQRLEADVIVLGFTQPTYELQVHLGQKATVIGSPPVVRTSGPTIVPALAVGEAAGDVEPAGAADRSAARVRSWLGDGGSDLGNGSSPNDRPDLETPVVFAPNATVCICEDVTVAAIDAAIAEGFGDIELLKRRSGACTGACQGKLCLGPIGEVLKARGLEAGLPTIRPPVRPASVASLAGEMDA